VRLSCTDSKLFPSLDLVWAGFNAIMAIVVATDDLSTNTGAQIAVNAGWVVFSGLSGYEKVRDCRAAHDLRATQNNQDDGANAAGLALLPTSVTELPRGPLPSPSPAGLGAGKLVKLAEELEG